MVSRIIQVKIFDIVVFGATGDLACRKIFPALYSRFLAGQMPENAMIIGVARQNISIDNFRKIVVKSLRRYLKGCQVQEDVIEKFFIISVFNRLNMQNLETEFYDYYLLEVKKIIENKKNIYFINTKHHLRTIEKNESLFCDSMHHNYEGKFLIAKIISKLINGYK